MSAIRLSCSLALARMFATSTRYSCGCARCPPGRAASSSTWLTRSSSSLAVGSNIVARAALCFSNHSSTILPIAARAATPAPDITCERRSRSSFRRSAWSSRAVARLSLVSIVNCTVAISFCADALYSRNNLDVSKSASLPLTTVGALSAYSFTTATCCAVFRMVSNRFAARTDLARNSFLKGALSPCHFCTVYTSTVNFFLMAA
mmetsp:Transcript_11465/g.35401  ORF Transcript_11465/g.35401 Transcript_11465/m.35401 type:complete len:205 (+) Transcript_11465:208-822(+)